MTAVPRIGLNFLTLAICTVFATGCSSEIVWKDAPPPPGGYYPGEMPPAPTLPEAAGPVYQNPVLVPPGDHEFIWETVVDVVDDYFKIKEEEPVRLVGQLQTEGRLDTYPEVGSTVLEPWRRDSVGRRERWLATLQSIRRYAVVRVIPDPQRQGYLVEVNVYKELEDVAKPAHSSAGQATFRNDSSLHRVVDSLADQDPHKGWILLGRDPALEQRILSEIFTRTGSTMGYR